jgi:hypothetical protein
MISIIISCMNRTQNLCSVLESWIDQNKFITEIVLVDWSSNPCLKNNSLISKLITNKKINLIEVVDEKNFSLPKSYNLAFNKTKKENKYIIKLDSDYKLLDANLINDILNMNNFFIRGANKPHYPGFLAIERTNFLYYNENLCGWGYDDRDLYNRLKNNNLKEKIINNIDKYIYHIPHSDSDSVANYSIKNKAQSQTNNRLLAENTFTISEYETIYKTDCYERVKRIC